ncbi:MAG: spermidine synthase [Desulfobaccales bacterium]
MTKMDNLNRVSGDKILKSAKAPYLILMQSNLFKRIMLIIIAFVSGALIMIIELAANRVLAPWFGNSLFTWTGLIGVILIAMSVGYYLGGWLADQKSDYLTLSHILAASSVSILLIPLLQLALGNSMTDTDVMLGPVLASVLLFALPGCLLGSVSPYVIRLTSLLSSDKHIGLSAGTIFMYSTLGSVVGTFSAGFILIPQTQLSTIFIASSLLMMFLSISGYLILSADKKLLHISVLVSLITLLSALSIIIKPGIDKGVIYDKTTFYHRIKVFQKATNDRDIMTSLYLDTAFQGAQYDRSSQLPSKYQRYWELSKIFCSDVKHAAFLGAGAFGMPEALIKSYPEAKVDVVEIDPKIVEVGSLFFKTNNYPQLNIIINDARRYLLFTKNHYDLIFSDVFNGLRYVPTHLLSKEFFLLIKSRLDDRGVFMMNLIGTLHGRNSIIFNATLKTINSVFGRSYVFVINPKELDSIQNIIIIATNYDTQLDIPEIMQNNKNTQLKQLLSTFLNQKEYAYSVSQAPLLTDNYNPIEYFTAKSIYFANK